MTTKNFACLFIAAGMLVGCPKDDEGETNATVSTTQPTTTLGDGSTSDGETTNGTATSTTASTTVTTATEDTGPSDSSGGGMCTADDDCISDSDCAAGETCLAFPGCSCIGGTDESSGGGACPRGETCEMTGQGGMACLAESDHCVLFCNAMATCPDGMFCEGSVCHYDSGMLPMMGDPNYPLPDDMNVCPGTGEMPVTFAGAPFFVCAPLCDGMGVNAACPQGETGTAMGACLFNPDSSGDPC